ncbi:TetR/AcrR family transcriptional regulator [Streptomyces marincola]|uniref:TetR family transcriptional regulator n=1 Tax=Streptomyces marincola TaxID=2878388 RepID=A0A1W7D6B8_9ACTN|nr:TetR/AcrR family transcriptional regulator [Streptomyces marincola]ARQ72641.1 TetR family transcriptional regulator [Streptomyces marincola]
MAGTRADGRIARGEQTRRLVLGRAMEIASVEGLDALSMGRLASELKLSKSGVFALFGSKEDLQLATIRAAVAVFTEHVVGPARELPAGIGRLRHLCDRWLAYSRERVFPGGCFFSSVSAEYDARAGKVHDALVTARSDWLSYLERTAREARQAGELTADADLPQLVFELAALLEMANAESVLHDDVTAYGKAARGILDRLLRVAVDPSQLSAP